MAMFTYTCSDSECDTIFDKIVQSKDEDVECPECGSSANRRKFYGGHGIKYEADGFYATDYCDRNRD